MRWSRRLAAGVGVVALFTGGLPAYAGLQQDRVVSANPEDWTPIVQDGTVNATATVGGITVAVGNFTTVRERSATTSVTRTDIFAFDSSGRISTTFVPQVTGSSVSEVIPAGDGQSVYIAGTFSKVNGATSTAQIARVNVTTGQVVSTFKPAFINARVRDLHLANGKLYAGGYFTKVGASERTALVALDPQTGADTGSLNLTFSDTWNGGTVGVEQFTMTPDGSRLVAIGNFRNVNGQSRPQIAMVDTSGSAAALHSWATDRFGTTCHPNFATYTLDVDASPDGAYFVVVTTGAYSGGVTSGTLCDALSRWEFDASGPDQQPTWVDYTGGDTLTAVDVTGTAIYVGGHFRWLNNPFAGDAVGPGAVYRGGIAAVDPRNGLPFTWNPQRRTMGWGVGGMTSTPQGLWIGHDTDVIGGETVGRLALMPLAGGAVPPRDDTGSLPGNAYLMGKRSSAAGPSRVLYRVNAGGPELPAADELLNWAGDDSGQPSGLHNAGSNVSAWTNPTTRAATVPADTPLEIFSTERWDPSSDPAMEWDFPVAAGTAIQVRLFFANGYEGTSSPGSRVFDVNLDGTTVLDNYDIAADVGHQTGTMKSFDITSDGNVDIDFAHVAENPLINGIEIIRPDIPVPGPDENDDVWRNSLSETAFTGTAAAGSGGIDWSSSRGAFMADGRLYTGWKDGTFQSRTFNGSTFGARRIIDLRGLTAFAAELPGIRGMWFDRETGRMYYTLDGQKRLYYRYFTPQSSMVGAVRFELPETGAGIDWSTVNGGFVANGKLYFRNATGSLSSVQWTKDGPVPGTTQVVSGPLKDGVNWTSRTLFLHAP